MPTFITRVSGSRVTMPENVWMYRPPLEIVPLRDRKLRLVDGLAGDDHVLDRPGRDDPRGDRLAVRLHDVLDHLAVGRVRGESEGQRQAADTAEAAHEKLGAASGLVALDVLEEERGPLLLEHAARDRAQLAVPVHLGRDSPQLALLLEPRHPLPQVHEAHERARTDRMTITPPS